MFLCHADFADAADFFSYSRNALCKSVKSVGLKKELVRKNLRHLRNLRDLITCGLSRLDRIGRFPFKFRA